MKLYLTNLGQDLLYKAQGGKSLKFSRFGLGDGDLNGQAIQPLISLISQKMSLDLKRLEIRDDKVILGVFLDNKELTEGFYLKEIGIFAIDPDTDEELLYMYGNSGETSDYIDSNTGRLIEENLTVEIYVSNASNVTATIDESLVFALAKDTYNKTEVDTKIENINIKFDADIEEINNELNDLNENKYDIPTKVTSGENVYIEDAYGSPLVTLRGEGKCEQFTTIGKNEFELPPTQTKNGVTFTNNGNGTFNLTGTATADTAFYTDVPIEKIINGASYKLSTSGQQEFLLMVEKYNGGTWEGIIGRSDSSTSNPYTAVTEDLTKYIYAIRLISGTTVNIQNAWAMVEKGTEATPFEPYTGGQASPNPDYPQEITTVTEVGYKGVGKNYFNIGVKEDYFRTSTNGSTITNTSLSAIDFTIENNKLTINSYENTGYPWLSKWVDLEKNTDYMVSFLTNRSSVKIFGTNSKETGSVGELICEITSTTTKKAFNSGEYEYYFASFYPYNAETYLENIQIEVGTEATPYEPYQETTLPIDLQGNELCELDKLLIDRKGNVAIKKNMGKVVFDGNMQGSLRTDIQNENTICFRTDANVENIKNNTPVLSDYFTCLNNTEDIEHIRYVGNVGYRFQIFIDKTIATTADGVIAWLSENNVTVYYQLETPQIINLGTIENPEMFKGVNNIVVETNLGTIPIEVEYGITDLTKRFSEVYKDIKTIGEQVNEISDKIKGDIPTKLSDLENDTGFKTITASTEDLEAGVSELPNGHIHIVYE